MSYVPRDEGLQQALDCGGKWGAVYYCLNGFLLRWAAEEDASAQALEGKPEVHDVAHGHEGHRDEDEHAKGFGVGRQDHHDEMQEVQEVVHGVLDAVNHPTLRLRNVLLDELRHSEVERPQA